MTERSPRMSAAHSSRHLARVFALLGLYQWLADPEQDYAAIEAHLAGLIEDEGEQIEGCDSSSRRRSTAISRASRSSSAPCSSSAPSNSSPVRKRPGASS